MVLVPMALKSVMEIVALITVLLVRVVLMVTVRTALVAVALITVDQLGVIMLICHQYNQLKQTSCVYKNSHKQV